MITVSLVRILIILVNGSTVLSLLCLSCKNVRYVQDCLTVEECGAHQKCYSNRVTDSHGTHTYSLGCVDQFACVHQSVQKEKKKESTHGKTTSASVKTTNTPHLTTSPPPVTSTTPPLTVATPPNIHVLVSGPHISSYGSHVQINFIIMPLPQSYVWKFNGTHALPKGVSIQDSEGSLAGMATIVIAKLNETTSGTYSCIPTVNGRQVEKTHFIGIQQERPTVYISKPAVTTSFVLVCNVTGYPLPLIQWDFVPSGIGSHGIPPGVQFSTEKLKSALYVGAYNPAYHNGVWYCRASNALGSAITSVHIH
ncbi:peroxidasin-like [Mercenaria mercenaria]|uniref:peroxidasin-like n=1 Tax=Mercenaria mercenaria TaxID=6596 RepID=UPI00234E40CE|nr:peroxidasin-like [Mercenaria mercenaria]